MREKKRYALRIVLSGPENVDVHVKCSIEGVVIKWAQQITEVLRQDPAVILAPEKNALPADGKYFSSSVLILFLPCWGHLFKIYFQP